MVITLWLTGACVWVTEVSSVTVSIILAATGVTFQVTDGIGIGTVQGIVMATWTAPIISLTVSPTESTVVIVSVTDLVPASTE